MQGLRAQWDESTLNRLKQQWDSTIKSLNSQGKVSLDLKDVNNDISKLESLIKNKFDLKLNTAPIQEGLKDTVKGIDEAIAKYKQFGEVSTSGIKYDNNGNLQSFIVQLKTAEGLVSKLKMNATTFEPTSGNQLKPTGYGVQNVSVTDNTNKVIEQQIQAINKAIEQANAEIKQSEQDSIDLANAMGKVREQSELRVQAEQKAQELSQARASNSAQQSEMNRVNGLGEFQSSFDPSLLNKTNAEIKSYMQNLLGANTQIMNIKKSTDGLGQSTVSLTTNVKNGNGVISQEKLVLDQATGSIYKESSAIKEVNDHHSSFVDRIKQSIAAVTSFGLITGSVYGTISKFKEGIQTINDLNKAQTTIEFITGMNANEVQGLTKQYSNLAGQLHETTSGIMDASQEFLRAGNNAQETSALLQASTVMSKLAGQSQQDSAQSLISIMNSYHMSANEMMSVVDRMTSVDNMSATSTAELSAAIQKVAATAQNSGISLTSLISYIGTISSVTRQSADTIGTALNSVLSRYNAVKAGISQDEDGEPVNMVEKSLNSMGIAIRTSAGQFKDFNSVLSDISGKWKSLDQVQQNEIVTVLGGTRQRNYLLTLLNNMNTTLELQSVQANSAGNAMNRYGTYAESTEAKVNDLKNAQEQMWMSFLHSDVINGVISGLTEVVKTIQFLGTDALQSTLKVAALGAVLIALVKNSSNVIFFLSGLGQAFLGTATMADVMGASFTGIALAWGKLKAAMTTLFLTPQGLAFMAIVTAVGLATAGIIKHIQAQKELAEQTQKNTQSYKDLTQAMNENNTAQIKNNTTDLEAQQKKLSDLLAQRKASEDAMKSMQAKGENYIGGASTGQMSSDLNSLTSYTDKQIADLKKSLTDAGFTIDETTGKIVELEVAQSRIATNDTIDKINKEKQAMIDHDNEIINLINEYNQLSSVENANANQKQRMSQISQQLAGEINGLIVVKDAEGNVTIQNTNLLGKEIQMRGSDIQSAQTAANVKLQTAKNNAQAQVGVNEKIIYLYIKLPLSSNRHSKQHIYAGNS